MLMKSCQALKEYLSSNHIMKLKIQCSLTLIDSQKIFGIVKYDSVM